MAVTNDEELRQVYQPPVPRAVQKVPDWQGMPCRNFIALAPLCVLSSSNIRTTGRHPGWCGTRDGHGPRRTGRPPGSRQDWRLMSG